MEQVRAEQLKAGLWGAAVGAAAIAIVGFNWGGWVTGGTAEQKAKQRADSAVVAALAPICVNTFRHASDASAQLIELKKVSTWEQASFVEKRGWATMPGSTSADSAVARACASLITDLKL